MKEVKGNEIIEYPYTEEIQIISDMKECFNDYCGRNDFELDDKDIEDLKNGKIINASIQGEYSMTLRYRKNDKNEKEITKWLIDNVFRNEKLMFNAIRDDSDTMWDLLEIIASLHNEYYKLATGEYYDYMFHWVNKTTGGSIADDIFKKG